MRLWFSFGLLISGFFAMVPAVQAEKIMIENRRGEKVKFCTYRSDDKSLVRPRKCWMLRSGQRLKWDREGASHAFDVRLFEPGLFELPICFFPNISDSFRIEINRRGSDKCVKPFKRIAVPVRNWAPGERALVNNPTDIFWYPAVILGVEADGYRVRQAGRYTLTVDKSMLTERALLKSAKVQMNWKLQGRWDDVDLIEVTDEQVLVRFDDGFEERAPLTHLRFELLPPQ